MFGEGRQHVLLADGRRFLHREVHQLDPAGDERKRAGREAQAQFTQHHRPAVPAGLARRDRRGLFGRPPLDRRGGDLRTPHPDGVPAAAGLVVERLVAPVDPDLRQRRARPAGESQPGGELVVAQRSDPVRRPATLVVRLRGEPAVGVGRRGQQGTTRRPSAHDLGDLPQPGRHQRHRRGLLLGRPGLRLSLPGDVRTVDHPGDDRRERGPRQEVGRRLGRRDDQACDVLALGIDAFPCPADQRRQRGRRFRGPGEPGQRQFELDGIDALLQQGGHPVHGLGVGPGRHRHRLGKRRRRHRRLGHLHRVAGGHEFAHHGGCEQVALLADHGGAAVGLQQRNGGSLHVGVWVLQAEGGSREQLVDVGAVVPGQRTEDLQDRCRVALRTGQRRAASGDELRRVEPTGPVDGGELPHRQRHRRRDRRAEQQPQQVLVDGRLRGRRLQQRIGLGEPAGAVAGEVAVQRLQAAAQHPGPVQRAVGDQRQHGVLPARLVGGEFVDVGQRDLAAALDLEDAPEHLLAQFVVVAQQERPDPPVVPRAESTDHRQHVVVGVLDGSAAEHLVQPDRDEVR